MAKRIVSHHELEAYKKAFAAAMKIFELSRGVPARGNVFVDGPGPPILPLR